MATESPSGSKHSDYQTPIQISALNSGEDGWTRYILDIRLQLP